MEEYIENEENHKLCNHTDLVDRCDGIVEQSEFSIPVLVPAWAAFCRAGGYRFRDWERVRSWAWKEHPYVHDIWICLVAAIAQTNES